MNATPNGGAHATRAIELAAVLDLRAAAPLAAKFLARRGEAVEVDASRVQRMGGQCLQILLSAIKTWKADAIPLAVVEPSFGFIEGVRRLGVATAEFLDEEDVPQ